MAITRYPGPKGQIFMKGSDEPAKFCSTRDMMIFALQPENRRQIEAIFVHDMAATDWESPADTAFISAEDAKFVYHTSKKAVMGPAVAPFSDENAATTFIDEWGGKLYSLDQITIDLLEKP
ncbi:hypothetical protein GCM10007894_02120 [Paraferrimonas haliotis]|uniref:Nitrous oxide reductase accessory protein NosL n=2 Tax=Paraferrimonas haliotis TaxID=2013866 RepID=A0AA37WX91_9GAMM|nr:hypothetical protein GCM10007894_02120 [Paraferrimonas haliotis]